MHNSIATCFSFNFFNFPTFHASPSSFPQVTSEKKNNSSTFQLRFGLQCDRLEKEKAGKA